MKMNLDEGAFLTKKAEVTENALLLQETVEETVNQICGSLNKLMDRIYFELIQPGIESASDAQISQKFLELANCLFFVNEKADRLNIYDGVSKIGLKSAYNEAYLNPALMKAKPTIAELQASAENRTVYDQAVNETYSRAAKMVKSKIDCGQTMLNSLNKILTMRMSQKEISDKIPATPRTILNEQKGMRVDYEQVE